MAGKTLEENENREKGNFVHLHCHSEYSTLDSINRVDTLPEYVKGLGQTSLALTDHGNVSGSYRFVKACRKAGVRPVVGMEAYYTVQDRRLREKDELGESYYHLVLLAMDNEGLHNLFRLSSYAYTEGMYSKPRIDDDLLGRFSKGVAATSACLGSRVSQLILKNQTREAEALLLHHANIFQDRFFIELQLHEEEEQQKVNKVLLEVASRHELPLILTGDCHYTHEEDKDLHELALCMQTNDVMSNPKRFSFGDIKVHVADHDWMWERAQRQGIPYEAIHNTSVVASMVDSASYFQNITNRYPRFQGLPEGLSSWEALENLSKSMLSEKFGGRPPVVYCERLNHELKVIKQMGFSDYLLIVWEIINGAREVEVMMGPGRGSVGGSLVAYALGITKVDPIQYGLLFERFLNIGRSSSPIIFSLDARTQIASLV